MTDEVGQVVSHKVVYSRMHTNKINIICLKIEEEAFFLIDDQTYLKKAFFGLLFYPAGSGLKKEKPMEDTNK